MNTIGEEFRAYLIKQGASVVGFADLSMLPASVRNGYNFGVSIAVALQPEKVRAIYPGPSLDYYHEYRNVSGKLKSIANDGALYLKNKGIDALPLTGGNVEKDDAVFRSKLPFKTVATIAGLGWIGKCAFLVTEKYGAAVRLGVILTNKQFGIGTPITTSRCGNCEKCKIICPADGVSGKQWEIGVDRDELLNAKECKAKVIERGKSLNGLEEGTCGLCIWACPWTQRYLGKI